MAGYRFCISLVVGLALAQSAFAQVDTPPTFSGFRSVQPSELVKMNAHVTKVYSLSDLGDDQNLCKWIAETIPQMIQPGSWSDEEGKKNLSFYAPGRVIVICHTPAVHAQVEDFIQGLKKAMPPRVMHGGQLMPAQFAPDAPRVGPTVAASQAYPIAYPPVAPKHLFHFIIRYEGEGIIDSNVTKFTKAFVEAQKGNSSESLRLPPPTTLPNPPSTSPFGTVQPAESTNPSAPVKMPPADPVAPVGPTAPTTLPSVPSVPPALPLPPSSSTSRFPY